MNEQQLNLLIDLHVQAERQGPGSGAMTENALELAGLDKDAPLRVLDIGCGTGASTFVLAEKLNASITAVDFLTPFLDTLQQRAQDRGIASSITPLQAPMEDLPFESESVDLIWSEGAIYNMGFSQGINDWKRFLKPGGMIVVSEITWLTHTRPMDIQKHWQQAYPEIDVASAKIGILEQAGLIPEGYFYLPPACWLDEYYIPMELRFESFLEKHTSQREMALELVQQEQQEIALYRANMDYYSYGVYIARKP